jgi:hypothetical protein
MIEDLKSVFPSIKDEELVDDYIVEHPNLQWDAPEIPMIRAVPLYMHWCLRNPDKESELVFSDLIAALNAYARSKAGCSASMNFALECSFEQSKVVLAFLDWYKRSLLLDYDPVLDRAIRNWETVNKRLQPTSG